MKLDTLYKAQELNTNILDIESLINQIEGGDKSCGGPALNFSFCHTTEEEAIKTHVLTYLKNRKKKLQKEFDNLK